jgi:pyruvate dehydrogenase E2 component (dihydrolipoamide acetyltransferase)
MEEATIVAWRVADGDEVTAGQEIAEVETDKAIVPLEAEHAGVIAFVVAAGETVPLGAVIARIAVTGESDITVRGDGSAAVGANASPPSAAVLPSLPILPEQASPHPFGDSPTRTRTPAGRAPASPAARRLATSLEVDLHDLTGTGPRGRITRGDVERAAQSNANPRRGASATPAVHPARQATAHPAFDVSPASAPPNGPPGAKGDTTILDLSRTQQVIARRMSESRATVPDFNLMVEVDMDAAWALRDQLKQAAEADTAVPSLNDIVVMACARALREQPQVNSSYRDGRLELFSRVNVGVAIATPDSLVVATVFDADQQTLTSIARTTSRLASRVRDGSVTPPELGGATFTVSNLGMFGIDQFTAVINPPQAAILAVGAVKPTAVVREGQLTVRRCMTMTLSADHRALYGADGARFLARVRHLLEHPLAMLAS